MIMVNNIMAVDVKESHTWLIIKGVQAFMHCTLRQQGMADIL